MKLFRLMWLAGLLLTACGIGGCREEAPEPRDEMLLRVGQRPVSLGEFRREVARTLPSAEEVSAEDRQSLERALLVQIIDRELVLAEADRLGIRVHPDELEEALERYRREYPAAAFETMLEKRNLNLDQWRGNVRRRLLMEKVARQAVYRRVGVSDEEVTAYYRSHLEEFKRPEQVRARQIMVDTEKKGQRVLGLLRGGEPFAEVAAAHSLSPDAEEGGDLGFFARGEMPPEFDAVVFDLAPGRLSDLVKSEYGYHVFLVEERRPARDLALDEVRDEIRRRLLAEKKEEAYHQWLQGLRSEAVIEVDWQLLERR